MGRLTLIDFDCYSFHVFTEPTRQNGDEEFRPDIALLINGMPLVFTEVKKSNDRDAIHAERSRINARTFAGLRHRRLCRPAER